MPKTIFEICTAVIVASLVLNESFNIWVRMFLLIFLVTWAWLDGAVRESERGLKQLRELNEEAKKCLTLLKR